MSADKYPRIFACYIKAIVYLVYQSSALHSGMLCNFGNFKEKKLFQKQLHNQNQDKYKKSEITVRYFACRTEKQF